MQILKEVEVEVVQKHEMEIKANARLGGYDLDKYCPLSEFKAFRVCLERVDADRLYLLSQFAEYTKAQTCKLLDALPETASNPRVATFISRIDLRSAVKLELVIISVNARRGPLVIIDGNHRAIAHWLTHKCIHGVPAYVCEHPNVNQWPFLPQSARETIS